eukprot:2359682-Amphidinium_carterae.1
MMHGKHAITAASAHSLCLGRRNARSSEGDWWANDALKVQIGDFKWDVLSHLWFDQKLPIGTAANPKSVSARELENNTSKTVVTSTPCSSF